MVKILKANFLKFLTLHFLFALLLIGLRVFEQVVLNFYQSLNFNPVLYIGYGINFDCLFVAACSVFLLVPYLLITLWNARVAIVIIRIILFILLFIHLALTQYFFATLTLLDDTLFYFNIGEINQTIFGEATNFHWYTWALLAFFLSLGIWLLLIKRAWFIQNAKLQVLFIIIYGVVVFATIKNLKTTVPAQFRFDNYMEYQLSNNKALYFIHTYIINSENKKKYKDITPEELKEAIKRYHKDHSYFNFCNENYPLVHNEPYENSLGEYFPERKEKPNIVILICESMSASFCGPSAYLGHFTPFLDSLIDKSLYWNNFLSNAEHTYGALPNVLASLPYCGERGFINYVNGNYPFHNSLITLLHKNNYRTNFFYGGWIGFDHTDNFIKYNQVDYYLDESKFNKTKYHKKEKTWGYNDKDLFNQAFEVMNGENIKSPYLDIYLTLSMHDPYNMLTKEYDKTYLERCLEKQGIKGERKRNLMNYSDGILSIMFTDDALKGFFENYKKRSDFENTIFFITGDHNMYLFPLKNPLETYHVPLIIYSPMLIKKEQFSAVSFHSDITPAIIALLQNNFNLNFPSEKHWLARGLDTYKDFRMRNEMPLASFNGNYSTYIGNGHFLINNELYKVDKNLNLLPYPAEEIRKEFLQKLNDFSIINLFVTGNNKIISR
jgi:phosphoglycerol transferase MdoB-like AlkP superfamily enzyme